MRTGISITLLLNIAIATLYSQNANLKAERIDLDPTIDGILEEKIWENVQSFSGFKMVEPVPGSVPSEKTELKIIYTRNSLVFGVTCFDSQPKRISANTMMHDQSEERNEDQLSILLDPFMDKRSGYIFIVNPKGARSEGFASGEHLSLAWDGLWEAKCRIDSLGWTAEIRIPFLTISFNPRLKEWGINIERFIARKQEVIRFSGISLNSFFSNSGEAGILEGIENIKQGLGITVRPYGKLSRNDRMTDNLRPENKITGGFDVYKNITPNLVGAVTVNTDFAETEVDDRKLNLTRFPLFYPEKRTFFLEGSDIFEFGGTSSSTFLPFFSRRIGLYQGEPIPLNWGTKLYGRIGKTNISMLDVQSGRSEIADPTNMFAGRIYQNILKESRFGFIFTNGSQHGEANSLAGADFRFKTSKFRGSDNLSVDIWGVRNWNKKQGGNKDGFGIKLDYPNDLIDAAVSYTFFGDSIDPGLGFLPRKAFHSLNTGISIMPRPEKGIIGDFIRQWFFEFRTTSYWNLKGTIESSRIFIAPVNFRTESGEQMEFNIIATREVLPVDFEVSDGIVISKGDYKFTNYRMELKTAPHRKLQFDFGYQFGKFYDGHLKEFETGFSLRLDGYATMQFGTNNVRGNLPEGKFSENVYFTKLNLYINPDLGISNYLQYDDVSNQLGYNGRFFWQIRPGNIIYLVYNSNTRRVYEPEKRFVKEEDQVLFKVQLSIRF